MGKVPISTNVHFHHVAAVGAYEDKGKNARWFKLTLADSDGWHTGDVTIFLDEHNVFSLRRVLADYLVSVGWTVTPPERETVSAKGDAT